MPKFLPALLLAPCLAAPALACVEHYVEDVAGNCCPDGQQYGCLVPDQGNIQQFARVKDLINGAEYTCEAAPYLFCTAQQMGGGGSQPHDQPARQNAQPIPPADLGKASKVNNESSRERAQDISALGGAGLNGQNQAKQSSLEVVRLGANQAASAGAVFCAEAAVEMDSKPELAASDSARCQKSFSSAREMKAMAEKLGKNSGFEPDPAVVNKGDADAIFQRFRAKFGIAKADYLSRMLGGNGEPRVLEELTGGKVPAEKFGELAATAPADAPPETEQPAGPRRHSFPAEEKFSLRDELRAELEKSGNRTAQEGMSLKRNVASEILTPLENPFAPGEDQGLTLFEVVHLKYMEKAPSLLPYRYKR